MLLYRADVALVVDGDRLKIQAHAERIAIEHVRWRRAATVNRRITPREMLREIDVAPPARDTPGWDDVVAAYARAWLRMNGGGDADGG